MRSVWNRLFNLTGFRGKTLWDLLGLLIVPVVIALAGWYLSEVSMNQSQNGHACGTSATNDENRLFSWQIAKTCGVRS
jgi:hypothetical protein